MKLGWEKVFAFCRNDLMEFGGGGSVARLGADRGRVEYLKLC
jgi:hypothetical protein